MNVINKIVNKKEFFPALIVVLLSSIFIGYALSSILLGIFLVGSLYYAVINKSTIQFDITLVSPIVLYLLFCISYFWSVDANNTVKGIGRTIALFIIPLSFLIIPKFKRVQFNFILKWFTFINAIYGIFFLIVASLEFMKSKDFSVYTYHDLVKFLDLNAIYVSSFYIISVFYLLNKKQKSVLDIAILLFLLTMVFLLASKMILAVFFIALTIYLISFKSFRKIKTKKNVLGLIIIFLVFALASFQVVNRLSIEKKTNINDVLNNERFNRVYPWTGTSFRLLQLRILGEQINEERIFFKGFGLFASRNNLKERHLAFNTYYGYHTYNYHNMYAQILAEVGIIGLLILLFMLAISLIRAIKSKELIFILFCILFFMVFISESFLWVHRGLFYFTIMYCLFNRCIFINPKTEIN